MLFEKNRLFLFPHFKQIIMKNLYKIVALACTGLSVIFILLGGIALLSGGRLFGHLWNSYLSPSHYLMMFGILMLLFILAEKEKKE
jgi:hypothetical protein